MEQGLQQFVGSPIEIIYLDRDDRTVQRKIDILTAGDQCVFAYCFARREPELFRNRDILAVLPVVRRNH